MSTIVPISSAAPTLSGPFYRTRGDDWRGTQALAFQYGQYVPASTVTNPDGTTAAVPASMTGYDITGWQPVGRFLVRPKPRPAPYDSGSPHTLYQPVPDCTLANGFAIVTDAPNGKFSITPDRTVTAQFAAQWFDATADAAALILSVKLIDSLGNLGTITRVPIIVSYG